MAKLKPGYCEKCQNSEQNRMPQVSFFCLDTNRIYENIFFIYNIYFCVLCESTNYNDEIVTGFLLN